MARTEERRFFLRTKHCVAWPCSLMLLLALASEASAQSSSSPSPPPPPSPEAAGAGEAPVAWTPAWKSSVPSAVTRRWYGWQILIGVTTSDLLLAAGFAGGAASGKPDGIPMPTILLAPNGLVGRAFSGPVIHWAHGHVGRGFISLGMNLMCPVIGAGLGAVAGGGGEDSFLGGIAGGFTGAVIASAIDIGALAYEDVEVHAPVERTPSEWATTVTLVPIVGQGRTGLGIAGVF